MISLRTLLKGIGATIIIAVVGIRLFKRKEPDWHHYVVVKKPDNIKCFLDGVETELMKEHIVLIDCATKYFKNIHK